jgi:puromycin-sensitive aminopeptidase
LASAPKRSRRAPQAFRLPEYVRPEHYALAIEVDPQRGRTYRGRVSIQVRVLRACAAIELHAVDLHIQSARIAADEGEAKASIELVPEHESVRLVPPKGLAAGSYTLELRFRGRLRDDLRGLYFARRHARRYAFTQLEAADARRFFPCFDEPSFKARFTLEVITAASHTVISNAEIASVTRVPSGRKRVVFETTPLLSTYLVALAVGELRASRAVTAGNVPIRVWAVPSEAGAPPMHAFALEAARQCLLRLEQYFGVPYPYTKLDLVAVPDFEAGAMENAGAVFFRETLLLIDERRATLREKKRAIEVICHELAHMWYGDLVTMAWWDDLWLNEAFATWMAFEIVDRVRPELRMWNDFGHSRSSALALDALDSTYPSYTEVRTAAEATQNFDLITYEKGAAVIRMLERFLGPQRFRRGVRDYIRRHREGNATAADLWRALERHAGQDVGKVVRPWIERPGFPLLNVRARTRGRGRELSLRQQRFSAKGPAASAAASDAPWPIPALLGIGGARGTKRLPMLVTGRSARVSLPSGARFVYANADEGGFYRPLHDRALLRDVIANLPRLSAAERLGLIGHTWALVHAGYSSLDDLLDLASACGSETDPDVLSALYSPLWHVLDRVARPASGGDSVRGPSAALRERMAATFGPALEAAGLQPARKEPEDARLRRAELLRILGVLCEDKATVEQGEQRLLRYLEDPARLDANLAGPLIVIGARRGDNARHRRYLKLSEHAGTPQERLRFRMALAEFRDPRCIARSLELCRGPRIPTQDVPLLLSRLIDNPAARGATWTFLQKHWKEVRARVPPMLASRLIDSTPALASVASKREVIAFFERHPLPTAQRALRQAGERFVLDAALRARATPVLLRWLAAPRRA